MLCTDVISSLHERLSKGSRPLVLLGVGVLVCVIHLLTAPFRVTLSVMIFSLVIPTLMLGIGPIPWQWTGDDSPKAKPLRGLLQAVIIGGVWMGLIVTYLIFWGPPSGYQDPVRLRAAFIGKLGLAAFLLLVTVGFGWILSEQEDTETRRRATADRLHESQRRALQNQMEPHVLYNALNSIAGLIQEDQEAAEDSIVLLAELYRTLAKQGGAAQIPLGEERRLVEAYLVMEQMRLGERLKVQWVWAEGEDQVTVPPLLLQPLVENAIKHGISPSLEGGTLVITYDRQGEGHMLQVANTGRTPEKDAPKGVGMGNLEARLALWPDVGANLGFSRQGDWTLSTLRWAPKGRA